MATVNKKPSKTSIPVLSWNEARPESIVLITGAETYLADRAYRNIKDILKFENDGEIELYEFDAANYNKGDIFSYASPSLFDDYKLIYYINAEKCSDDFVEDMKIYLEAVVSNCTLVIRHAGSQRAKSLLDKIRLQKNNAIEISCLEIKKDQEKINFVKQEFNNAKRDINIRAVNSLVQAFNKNLAELAGACNQIILDTSGVVTEETINLYYNGRAEVNAFTIADYAISGRVASALTSLRHALSTGNEALMILGALGMKLRMMARVYDSDMSTTDLANKYGLAAWQVDRAKRDVRGWEERKLANCIIALAETDVALKGGSRDPQYVLEKFILLVCNKGNQI